MYKRLKPKIGDRVGEIEVIKLLGRRNGRTWVKVRNTRNKIEKEVIAANFYNSKEKLLAKEDFIHGRPFSRKNAYAIGEICGDLQLLEIRPKIKNHIRLYVKNLKNGLEKEINACQFYYGYKLLTKEKLAEVNRKNNEINKKYTWNDIYNKCQELKFKFINGPGPSDLKYYDAYKKVWEFECFCGRIFTPSLNNIVRGGVKSCGCTKIFSQLQVYEFIRIFYPSAISNKRGYFKEHPRLQIDIFIPELKIGIEFIGEYWHSKPKVIKNDKIKAEMFKKYSYIMLYIYYNDFVANKDKALNDLLTRIKELKP